MASRMRWLGDGFELRLKGHAVRAMQEIVDTVRDDIQESISTPYPPPSSPGDPPHMRSGELEASIESDVRREGNEVVGTVTCTAPYGAELERGTSEMPARPFMRPGMARTRSEVREIFGRSV